MIIIDHESIEYSVPILSLSKLFTYMKQHGRQNYILSTGIKQNILYNNGYHLSALTAEIPNTSFKLLT